MSKQSISLSRALLVPEIVDARSLASLVDGGRSPAADASWRHGKRVRRARALRDEDVDARIDVVLPAPRVASNDEVESFFANPTAARV